MGRKATLRGAANLIVWIQALGFMRFTVVRETIDYDFDPLEMLRASIQPPVVHGLLGHISVPTFGDSSDIVDERSGDGGVD